MWRSEVVEVIPSLDGNKRGELGQGDGVVCEEGAGSGEDSTTTACSAAHVGFTTQVISNESSSGVTGTTPPSCALPSCALPGPPSCAGYWKVLSCEMTVLRE